MSDWISVILLKKSTPRRDRAGMEPDGTIEVDVVNALMHRRNAEKISSDRPTQPQTSQERRDGSSDNGMQTPTALISLFEALSGGHQCDANGDRWVVTLSRRRNIESDAKVRTSLLPERVFFGPYCYRTKPSQVEAGGKISALTPSEAGLLEVLLRRAGQVVDRSELLTAVAPLQSDERTVDRAVCRLRQKLSSIDEQHANILRTARTRGYIILGNTYEYPLMG